MKGLRGISNRTSKTAERRSDDAHFVRYRYNERRLVITMMLLAILALSSTTVSKHLFVYKNFDKWVSALSEASNSMYKDLPTTSFLVGHNDQHGHGGDAKLTVDIISVGSKTRPGYLRAQREAFHHLSNKRNASSANWEFRKFLSYTEDDDSEPQCHTNLTKEQVFEVSGFCRSNRPATFSWKMRHLHFDFGNTKWLAAKGDGMIGWMCAQKRLPESFAVGLNTYKNNVSDLPDYLMITDDDTYFNLPAMIPALQGQYPPYEGYSIAGCLVASEVQSFPYGGFGTILTRKASERFLHPLHCNFQTATENTNLTEIKDRDLFDDEFEALACNRIKQNLIGERDVYTTGMTLAEMLESYMRRWNYTSVDTWDDVKPGLCLHSDWILGYWINSFYVSRHYGKSVVSHRQDDRIYPYFGSDMANPDPNSPFGIQCNNDKTCRSGDHVCHHLSPENITEMARI
mmetsp:Transcript_49728/g.120540  ORF Transcript_49728/g.120540 Transcript_49728/m.120540 type:complete len:458 (+) Transcript_49728:114-1487(+)